MYFPIRSWLVHVNMFLIDDIIIQITFSEDNVYDNIIAFL